MIQRHSIKQPPVVALRLADCFRHDEGRRDRQATKSLRDDIINDVYTSFKISPPVPTPCVCTSIKKLSRVLGRVYDAALAASPMNVTQLAVLRCIARRKGKPLLHVAEELKMDRSSLYRALGPMVRDNWVVITCGIDARSCTAVITREGHGLLKKAGEQWEKVQTRVVERFGRREWAAFVANIEKMRVCAEGDDTGNS